MIRVPAGGLFLRSALFGGNSGFAKEGWAVEGMGGEDAF
jgi:hypothetical protein